jgi:formate dehydrogenase major subunit
MVPWKAGKANHGHSCVKGRFAWGYATHKERVLEPMIRGSTEEPWRTVSWDEAIGYAAAEFAADRGRNTAPTPSAASPPRAARTKRPTSSRR